MLFPTAPKADRIVLAGHGDQVLGLVLRHAPATLWAQWLRLPLTGAAADGDFVFVQQLLAAGADGSSGRWREDGSTLLHAAAKGGSEAVTRALLEAGSASDVNQPTLVGNQEFPLHVAAKLGHVGVSFALVGAGATVNCRDRNGWTPLHLAARFGQIEVVIKLLRDGAERDTEDVNGYRPLHYATMWSHPATTKTLLKAGAALESITRVDGTRPLHIAARYGSALVVRELLGQGAEKDAKNARGFTALHAAAASNKVGAMNLLLAAGADINLTSRQQRFTPLHLAARRGAVEAAATLLEAGASFDVRTVDGSTPLHLACIFLKASVARLLLRHGADETAVNASKQTPRSVVALYLAEEDRDEALVAEISGHLAKAPADRAWRRRGWLVMMRARLMDGNESNDHNSGGVTTEGPRAGGRGRGEGGGASHDQEEENKERGQQGQLMISSTQDKAPARVSGTKRGGLCYADTAEETGIEDEGGGGSQQHTFQQRVIRARARGPGGGGGVGVGALRLVDSGNAQVMVSGDENCIPGGGPKSSPPYSSLPYLWEPSLPATLPSAAALPATCAACCSLPTLVCADRPASSSFEKEREAATVRGLVARVVRQQEDGIFQLVVSYL